MSKNSNGTSSSSLFCQVIPSKRVNFESSDMTLRSFSETPDIFKELPTSPSSSFEADNNRMKPLDVNVIQAASISPSFSSNSCSTSYQSQPHLQHNLFFQRQQQLLQEHDMTFSGGIRCESLPLTDVSALLFNRISTTVQHQLPQSDISSSFHPRSSCFETFDAALNRGDDEESLHALDHQYCRQDLCSVFNLLHPSSQQQQQHGFSSPSVSSCSSSFRTHSSFQTPTTISSTVNNANWEAFQSRDHCCLENVVSSSSPSYVSASHDPSSIYCSRLSGQQLEEGFTSCQGKSLSESLDRGNSPSCLFGLKVHEELTTTMSDHELQIHSQEDEVGQDPWNQFQGSVVSSFGRKYLQSQEKKEDKRRRLRIKNNNKDNKEGNNSCNGSVRKSSQESSCRAKSHASHLSSFLWKKVFPTRDASFHDSCPTVDSLHHHPSLLPENRLLHPDVTASSSPRGLNGHCKEIVGSRSPLGATDQESEEKSLDPSVVSSFQSKSCLNRRLFFLSNHCLLSTLSVTAFTLILLFMARLYIKDNDSRSAALTSSNGMKGSHSHRLGSKEWWKESILYEIFPVSFKDSDDDGFGDLRGIRSKIPYLKNLGVTGIRLSSIFAALDYPYQFDHVIDFKAVDAKLGSMRDFELLLQDIHDNDMTLILDINPTITSDQHPWATSWLSNKSVSASSSDHSSFYVVNRNYVSIMSPLTAITVVRS